MIFNCVWAWQEEGFWTALDPSLMDGDIKRLVSKTRLMGIPAFAGNKLVPPEDPPVTLLGPGAPSGGRN